MSRIAARISSAVFATLMLAGLFFALSACSLKAEQNSSAGAEKQVIFYPTYAYQQDGMWIIPMRLWVYEAPDAARLLTAKGARNIIQGNADIETLDQVQKDLFLTRVHGFIADSESREIVVFEFDDDPTHERFKLRQSVDSKSPLMMTDMNGLIDGYFNFSSDTAKRLLDAQNSTDGWLSFHAISKDHEGIGKVRLIKPAGISVISDIDDTIKITEINAGEATVMTNTFFKAFVAAPCMWEMYQGFGDAVPFHYVSGGPWQMYDQLSDFLFSDAVGFPSGSIHMKSVRTNLFAGESYHDLWRLYAGGSKQVSLQDKIHQISTILTHFPGRQFILIGDTGEKDPEVFTRIKEKFPEQVKEIRIRDVVDDATNNPDRIKGMKVISFGKEQYSSCSNYLN